MPELPDVVLYVKALDRLITGQPIRDIVVRSPFVVRTYSPAIESIVGQRILAVTRRGKRIVWETDAEIYLVFHLMIAGRFHWRKGRAKPRGKNDLAAFHFDAGALMLTEASPKKRAGVWCFPTSSAMEAQWPIGLNVLAADDAQIKTVLMQSNNTLKRALTDPQRFDGIGNAYSDEILHAARLSPLKRTLQLDEGELLRLCRSMRETLQEWIDRLEFQNGGEFPEQVTAFRPEMAVHGKFGQKCPRCGTKVQRIRYAENECNYCPHCQTEGRLLADRSLSRLLKDDWPKSIEELD